MTTQHTPQAGALLHSLGGRLSLRPPQAESLQRLHRAIEAAPALLDPRRPADHTPDTLARVQALHPTLQDFEREFPSLCFALATGVGKTRLMGAFIAYLHLAHGIHNFFVLAPNLTIYNKLIADFTPNTPKYVFKGISEFVFQPPLVITGDNYDQTGAAVTDDSNNSNSASGTLPGLHRDVRINIFNISKINSEVRGGKEPRIKRMKEVLGASYFDHLASLPDLVLLMDESHRYRASAGVRALNELNPLIGLEVTATPFTESTRGPVPFRNVVMDYPLARAIDDGFVKNPAVVTQRGFDPSAHTPEQLEKIKLEDGVRLHEVTKAELLTYAREHDARPVKPFMLVIARDTTHAAHLKTLVESDAFHSGRYAGKVIQVDSSQSGEKEDEMVRRLLAVESADEPTEIVIHVNMLKEGWDVTNLYTLVPLRAANARTLVEQSIGRGLRLPYGRRTGVEAVDRLHIVAHDRFQEIIDDCNRPDSQIRMQRVILDRPQPDRDERPDSVQVAPASTAPTCTRPQDIAAAICVMEQIGLYESRPDIAPTRTALLTPQVQQALTEAVTTHLTPTQGTLAGLETDLPAIVAATTAAVIRQTIDIPHILVVPSGDVQCGFHRFTLDTQGLRFQPTDRTLLLQNLRDHRQTTLAGELALKERRLEDYIVFALIDFDDVDYLTQQDLLYDLAGQMVMHLRSYLADDREVENVLSHYQREIARHLHAQMGAHFWERATAYEVRVSRGFTSLKPCTYTVPAGEAPRHARETLAEPGRIRQMLFSGFDRCLYPLQRFDSDTERRFALLLDRHTQKWFKPAKGQFQIGWRMGASQAEYVPDFVAETDDACLMVETKARNELDTPEVQAKADAAAQWCRHASAHTAAHGGKPWHYLLVPHDRVSEAMQLGDFLRFERVAAHVTGQP